MIMWMEERARNASWLVLLTLLTVATVACKRSAAKNADPRLIPEAFSREANDVITVGAPKAAVLRFLDDHKCRIDSGAGGRHLRGICTPEGVSVDIRVDFGDDDKAKVTTMWSRDAYR